MVSQRSNRPETEPSNRCHEATRRIEKQPITDQPRPLVTMLNCTNPRTAKNTHMQPNPHMHMYLQMYEYMYVNIYIYIYIYIRKKSKHIYKLVLCLVCTLCPWTATGRCLIDSEMCRHRESGERRATMHNRCTTTYLFAVFCLLSFAARHHLEALRTSIL